MVRRAAVILGTCDWGFCDALAVCWRYDPRSGLMLPVCEDHRPDYVLAA